MYSTINEIFLSEGCGTLDVKLVQYYVSKEEVLNNDFRGANKFVREISRIGKPLYQSATIAFSGYDHDARELFEIDEVRHWGKRFVLQNPHIFYFLSPMTETDQIMLLLVADHLETIYLGKKYPITYLLDELKLNFEELPRYEIYISLSKETFQKLKKGTLSYAKKIKHATGGKEVIKKLERYYGGEE